MKLDTSISVLEFVQKLDLAAETEARFLSRLAELGWNGQDQVEFTADVDRDEAFAAVEKEGMIPEPDFDELIDDDQLVDAVKAVLDGDLSTALLLFGRFLGNAGNDAQRRIEQLIYDRKRRMTESGLAAVARAA